MTFKVGDKVIATQAIGGYQYHLTPGKVYTVTNFQPQNVTPNFTFPEYVSVIGNMGKEVTAHTYRFQLAEEQQ